MLNRNKRAQLPALITLFVATFLIAAILILFVVSWGFVKPFSEAKNGEKIYNSTDVGIGSLKDSMGDYSRFTGSRGIIEEGTSVEDALELKEYGEGEVHG